MTESAWRLTVFLVLLGLFAAAEALWPRRPRNFPRRLRWPANLGMALVNTIVMRFAMPVFATGAAVVAQQNAIGLLNNWSLPLWVQLLVAFILMDFAIYLQHRIFHLVPVLWRVHRVHHADQDFDVTTGIRFHPIEIVLSMFIKVGLVFLLGPPVIAVVIFEIVLNGTSLFNHSNLSMPRQLDSALRWIIVTPDMHRVHHSILVNETNSNFGFNLPWWDRLLGTYRSQPREGHDNMTIGLEIFREEQELKLPRLLMQPFR